MPRRRSRSSSYEKNQRKNQNRRDRPEVEDHSHSSEEHEPKWKIEQTKTLKIENCSDVENAERTLVDCSIKVGTSVPDQIELKDDSIYAKYPSTEVSSAVLGFLENSIAINKRSYRINFHPFKKIDMNLTYDWYCEKCDYKNFARRNKCYRCQSEKTEGCRLNYNTQAKKYKNHEDNINTCSLMVRGAVIMDIQEEILLNLFEEYASIKDIRMIRNKMTGQLKDFAFIEFFSPQDAAIAYRHTAGPDFKVGGEKVSVMYSRNKSDDDYAKPLPYESRDRRGFGKRDRKQEGPVENYYNRQRQMEIQQEKQRPLITLQQLKEKHEQEMKKNVTAHRELTEEQNKRRQAELMAKQWEKEARIQNSIMYICVVCRRKFRNQEEMNLHENRSQLHKFNMEKFTLAI